MTDVVRSRVLSSWLEKQAEWRFAWDKRFFVLDGLRLAYSLSPKGAEKQTGHVVSLQCHPDSSHPHSFRVWLEEGGCWTLRAETAGEHEQWTRSLSDALLQNSERSLAQEEIQHTRDKCEGLVMKKSAWSGEWRERFVEIDGIHLTYRVKQSGPVRKRLVVVAADTAAVNGFHESACGDEEPRDANALYITASTGERFWLRLPTRSCCEDWTRTLHCALRRVSSWHWQFLASSPALRVLRAQFHAAATTRGCMYCFGGSAASGAMASTAKGVQGTSHDLLLTRGLSLLRLAGAHYCAAVDVRPFEESAHAKRCPPPAIGAGLCVVAAKPQCDSLHNNGDAENCCGNDDGGVQELVVLVGGRSAQVASRDAFSELWCCAPGNRAPQWHMHRYAATELPNISFHTIVPRGPRAALIVGGIDDTDRMRAECFSIEWPVSSPSSDMVDDVLATRPLVELCAYLPEPRAFHACVALRDDSLVVFGGCAAGDGVLRLASGSAEWRCVAADPPLPLLRCACACAAEPFRLFVMGEADGASEARLFQFVLDRADPTRATTREIAMEVGAVPRRCLGATLHCAGGYLYVIGGNGNGDDKAPLQDPVRAIIGDY